MSKARPKFTIDTCLGRNILSIKMAYLATLYSVYLSNLVTNALWPPELIPLPPNIRAHVE